jgi:CheY-like chemotaxis protein
MLARRIRDRLPDVPIMLFSSLGQREIGFDQGLFNAYLAKPLKQSLLFDALAGIFDPGSLSAPSASPPAELNPEMALQHPLRILLAEDNVVNQKLVMRLLQQMGYRADLASNGLEAIDALKRQIYDVILMDVQMPEMDGLEATHQIRLSSELTQPHIIGLTANALQGDREIDRQVGLDIRMRKRAAAETGARCELRIGRTTAVCLARSRHRRKRARRITGRRSASHLHQMSVLRKLTLQQGDVFGARLLAEHIVRAACQLADVNRHSRSQVRQSEGGDTVAAECRAEQGKQRLVLLDRQDLAGAGRPASRRKIEREHADLADIRLSHRSSPVASGVTASDLRMVGGRAL